MDSLLKITVVCFIICSLIPLMFAENTTANISSTTSGTIQNEEYYHLAYVDIRRAYLLITISEEDVRKWVTTRYPRTRQLPPQEQELVIKDILKFRENKRSQALARAVLLGLTITEENREQFIQDYWNHQIEIDREIERIVRPLRDELERNSITRLQEKYGRAVGTNKSKPQNNDSQQPAYPNSYPEGSSVPSAVDDKLIAVW